MCYFQGLSLTLDLWGRFVKVAVVGLGNVGMVTSAILASGVTGCGVDIERS